MNLPAEQNGYCENLCNTPRFPLANQRPFLTVPSEETSQELFLYSHLGSTPTGGGVAKSAGLHVGELEKVENTKRLPPHVKRVVRRGRAYYYLFRGRTAEGRRVYRRMPDIDDPGFAELYAAMVPQRRAPPVLVPEPRPVFTIKAPPTQKVARRVILQAHAKADELGARAGYAYFIGGDAGCIKIGSTWNPSVRARELQTGSPIPLRVLAAVPGGSFREKAYHWQFAKYRVHGEWFERHPDILAEIERLGPLSALPGNGEKG